MISLQRYSRMSDGDLFVSIYRDQQYKEFFRRCPPTWNDYEIRDFESLTQSQLFKVMLNDVVCGIMVVTQIDPFALTCQAGLLLLPEYRDEHIGDYKIAFWSAYKLCDMLFEMTTMRKISMRFLKSRADIEKSLLRGAFWKEAELKESCFCHGKFQDELEYAINKDSFEKLKETLCLS